MSSRRPDQIVRDSGALGLLPMYGKHDGLPMPVAALGSYDADGQCGFGWGSGGGHTDRSCCPQVGKEVLVTHVRPVLSPNDHHEQRVRGGDAFRARLEQHRRLRIEQLEGLEGDRSAGSDDATDDVASHLMVAASAASDEIDAALPADIVDVWGNDSFPASDPPANW
jgi:hypothetical protein